MKLYLETSVPNFLFSRQDAEKRLVTAHFFLEVRNGLHEVVTSTLYEWEVARHPSETMRAELLQILVDFSILVVPLKQEAYDLAVRYVACEAFTESNFQDALHVAIAAVEGCDGIVSWNFKHIVRAWTMQKVLQLHRRISEWIASPETAATGPVAWREMFETGQSHRHTSVICP